jgi:succinate dehydrogenase / fumarate reductase, cytochrome b subunit
MTQAERPLSPHLQIYKWQLTMAMSIVHRGTGLALAGGTVFLVWWLLAAASGDQAFAAADWFFGSWLGLVFLFGWCFCFFYHLCNGIRHLAWDAGYGFEIPTAYASGYVVVAAAIVLTLIAFVAGLVVAA